MTLRKEFRSVLRNKLGNISERQLNRRMHQTAMNSGITDLDVAGLVIAHGLGITVGKPKYGVQKADLEELSKVLARLNNSVQVVQQQVISSKKGRQIKTRKTKTTKRVPKFLNFEERYPAIFYKHIELEINMAAGYANIPTAVFVLCRKIVENLLYNLLQRKYAGSQIAKYFDVNNRRPLDFSVLITNLKYSKSDFDLDQHTNIDKFLILVHPFRENANSKAHNLLDYAESMKEVQNAKVSEMVELLLTLIESLRRPTVR